MRFEILSKFWSFSDDNATKAEMEECETATTNPNQQNCSKPIVASSNNKEYNDEQKKPNFICGVIEGFYGRPWTTEQRKDLFRKWVKVMRIDFSVTISMIRKWTFFQNIGRKDFMKIRNDVYILLNGILYFTNSVIQSHQVIWYFFLLYSTKREVKFSWIGTAEDQASKNS